MKGVRRKVAELGARPAPEIAAGVLADVKDFTHGQGQRDDVTLVGVKKERSRMKQPLK